MHPGWVYDGQVARFGGMGLVKALDKINWSTSALNPCSK